MLRSTATRSLLRSLAANPASLSTTSAAPIRQQLRSQLCTLSSGTRPQALKPFAPKTLALVRWQSGERKAGLEEINKAQEAELGKQKLEAHPEIVSSTSSTHPINSEIGMDPSREDQTEMMSGVKADLQTIRDTFSLEDVPRQAYYVGMAGVLPYLATSLSTVYCAWEINHAAETGSGLLMNGQTAELALHVIEPLQIGYGAVIISFLGAIHWGLEWAAFGGIHGYPRYMIGVVSTALAWPTLLLPVEYALISQFLIFNFLYYTDSRATKRGWAPAWYGVYRFVLTFIVGSAIVVSLIGRGQIAEQMTKLPSPTDRIRQLRDRQMQALEDEEEQRRKFLASKDEEEEEEEDEE